MLKHANTVLDDEEEVDAGQRREPLPHSIKGCSQISVTAGAVLAVVVLSLRLQKEQTLANEQIDIYIEA